MRKLIFFGSIVLIVYFAFFSKKFADKPKTLDVENTITANDTSYSPGKPADEDKEKTGVADKKNNQNIPPRAVVPRLAIGPSQNLNVSGAPKKNLQNSTIAEPVREESEIENRTKKFKQLTTEYGDYEATPKILTGISARVFSLSQPNDLFPELEIKDIRSAFAHGIYPRRDMIKTLRLDHIYEGTVYVDYPINHKIIWSLQIDNASNPVRGSFSLQIDGEEKSCKATGYGPLKNLVLLASDPGTLLVRSCDETIYMQLYRNGGAGLDGIYYEKGEDGRYKAYKDHSLALYRVSSK